MISTNTLAAELADKYDIDTGAAHTAVETYAGQINDDPDLYNPDGNQLTEAGAELVREQIAADYTTLGPVAANHDELRQAIRQSVSRAIKLEQERDEEIGKRDGLIRLAIEAGVRVEDIAQDAQIKRARVYQIRDSRR